MNDISVLKIKLVQADFNSRRTAKQIFPRRLTKHFIERLEGYGITSKLIDSRMGFTYQFDWTGDIQECLQAL